MTADIASLAARTDADLVRAAQGGEKGAFVDIVARHQKMVCSVTLGVLGDFAGSEDAAQDAFVRAWRNIKSLREPEKLRPWLAQTARCAALRHLERRRGRPAVSLTEDQQQAADEPTPDQAAATEEEAVLVRKALASLPEIYRLPLVLYYRHDQSVREAAKVLELSEDAVKQRLARGRELLRERITGLIGDALRRTLPGAVFTIGVASLIGALAPPAAVAGGSFAAGGASSSAGSPAGAASAAAPSGTAAAASATAVPAAAATTFFAIMNLSKLTLGAAALVAAGSFFIGRWTANPERPAAKEEPVRLAAGKRQTPAAGSGSSAKSTGAATGESGQGAAKENGNNVWQQMPAGPERSAAAAEKAKGILFEKNPARRLRLFSEFMEHFTVDDFEAVAESFAFHDQQGRLFGPEYNLFLATAGMNGGEAAMKKIFREGDPMNRSPLDAQHAAMTAWAVEDPVHAVNWWNALPEGTGKDELARSLINGVASKDINYAWQCLNAFPETERSKFMGSLVRQQIADAGAEGAARWLGSLQLEDGSDVAPLKQRGFDALLGAAVNISPAKKSEYINQFANEAWMQDSPFPGRVAEQWANRNGGEAVAWADGLPGGMRDSALTAALISWNSRNPSEFEAWKAANQTEPKFQQPLKGLEELERARAVKTEDGARGG